MSGGISIVVFRFFMVLSGSLSFFFLLLFLAECQVLIFPCHFIIPKCASGEEPACQCRRHKRRGFRPWVRKIPWRRAWQPTPVFLPGKSMGRAAWWVIVHGVTKSQTRLKRLTTSPGASSCQWNNQIKGGNVWIQSRKSETRQDVLRPNASHSTPWTLRLLTCETDAFQILFQLLNAFLHHQWNRFN